MAPQEGRRFSQEERLIADLPTLVRKSVGGQRDRELLYRKLLHAPTYEPVVAAVAAIQELLLSVPLRNPQRFEIIANFLGQLIHVTGPAETSRILPINDRTVKLTAQIQEGDQRLQENPYRYSMLPKNYTAAFPNLHAAIKKQGLEPQDSKKADGLLIIAFPRRAKPDENLIERQQALEKWNMWNTNIMDNFRRLEKDEDIAHHTALLDIVIDQLREEPEQTVFPQGALYRKKIDGMALADIESFPYPLSQENLTQITNWVISVLKTRSHPFHEKVIQQLFLGTIMFHNNIAGKIEYKNREYLKRISTWQENLVYRIMFNGTSEEDREIASLLQTFSTRELTGIAFAAYQWAVHPTEFDNEYEESVGQDFERYRLMALALRPHFETIGNAVFDTTYPDKIASEFFEDAAIPQLEKRLQSFGIDQEKINLVISAVKDVMQQEPFEKQHMYAIREVFRKASGEEFVNKLNEKEQELIITTKLAWESIPWRDTGENTAQSLPLREGREVILFTQKSLPGTLGIESIELRTLGTPQDWKIAVRFRMQNIPLSLLGALDREGNLTFSAPVEQEIPGLYAILKHIAVLAFHDLIVTEQAEHRKPLAAKKVVKKRPAEELTSHQPTLLPHRRTVQKLIQEVYKARSIRKKRQPRPVVIHRRLLKYAQGYIDAIEAYQKAKQSGTSEEITAALALLDITREQSYRFHMRKAFVPAKYQLREITDPVTKSTKIVQTWVIEHVNPKPKEGEDLPMLFVRYYKDTSALASLEQMKPWLIGEQN
ncbi:MAG: hypothetical protein HYT83_03945 [Candidatus Levybacteria bacterium]|nr:hypothetical protein [Candidatus Levybacteria bacterium]